MAQAQGEWITFVDADDLLTPRALEVMLFVYTYRHHIRQLTTVEDVVYRYRINTDSATFSPNLMKRATHHMIVANAFQQMIEQNTDPKAVETLTFVRNKILRFVQNETEQVLQMQKI